MGTFLVKSHDKIAGWFSDKRFSPPDYVTRNLIGQLGYIDFAITNFNP